MSHSTENLRRIFKDRLNQLKSATENADEIDLLKPIIEETSRFLEAAITQKLDSLAKDIEDFILKGEYLRTMTESLDDLGRFRETSKNLNTDVGHGDKALILKQVAHYYTHTLIPFFNLISKLEYDYVSLAKQTIAKKEELIERLEYKLSLLRTEKRRIKMSLWTFNNKRIELLSKKIDMLEFKQALLSLTLEHDKLNLSFYDQDHPDTLRDVKAKADAIRHDIRPYEEILYAQIIQ